MNFFFETFLAKLIEWSTFAFSLCDMNEGEIELQLPTSFLVCMTLFDSTSILLACKLGLHSAAYIVP